MSRSFIGRLVALLSLFAAVAILAGCGGSDKKPSPTSSASTRPDQTSTSARGSGGGPPAGSGGALVVNTNTGFANLDPAGCSSFSDAVVNQFYVQLTRYGTKPGPDGTQEVDPTKIEPYLAKSWKTSSDDRTYTFTLNDGGTFRSGTPVDAKAVKFSLERVLKMGLCGAYLVEDGFPGNIVKITTPNALTVKIELKHPDPTFAAAMTTFNASVVDPSVVKAHGGVKAGAVNTYMASHVAGSGPYRLASYDPNRQMVMTANPDFFGQAPKSSNVTINVVTSPATLQLQAESGQADITLGLTPASVEQIKQSGKARVEAYEQRAQRELVMPWNQAPFNNVKVRQALVMSLPYKDILEKIAKGYGELFYGPIIPGLAGFDSASQESAPTYDLAKAKQLISQAGPLKPVKLMVQQGNTIEEQLATIVQSAWKQLGIDVSIQKLSAADYSSALFGGKFQAALRSNGPGVFTPGFFLGYDMRCKVIGLGPNVSQMCIPQADKLLDQARTTADAGTRARLYGQIIDLWRAQYPKIILWEEQATPVLGKDVTSFTYDPNLRVYTWGK